MSVQYEIPLYDKGDMIRFTVEGEITHVQQSDTQPGRINYILDNRYVLLARERDKGTVVRIKKEATPTPSIVTRLWALLRAVLRL